MKHINQKIISAAEYSPHIKPGTPLLIEGCMILQCLKGTAVFKLDFKNFRISEGDFIFLFSDMVIELDECGPDYTVRYISVPDSQMFEVYINITSAKFWNTLYLSPVQKFHDRYFAAMDNWLKECVFVYDTCRRPVSDAVILKLMYSLFLILEDVMTRSIEGEDKKFEIGSWKFVGEFFVLLARHYTTRHQVSFYADRLNVTSDYFSVMIKKYTGFGPKEIIEGKLVLAMKALLESTSLPVKSIAERLHYDDTSHLCKVFRRHTGISPGEYRKQHMQPQ